MRFFVCSKCGCEVMPGDQVRLGDYFYCHDCMQEDEGLDGR